MPACARATSVQPPRVGGPAHQPLTVNSSPRRRLRDGVRWADVRTKAAPRRREEAQALAQRAVARRARELRVEGVDAQAQAEAQRGLLRGRAGVLRRRGGAVPGPRQVFVGASQDMVYDNVIMI